MINEREKYAVTNKLGKEQLCPAQSNILSALFLTGVLLSEPSEVHSTEGDRPPRPSVPSCDHKLFNCMRICDCRETSLDRTTETH